MQRIHYINLVVVLGRGLFSLHLFLLRQDCCKENDTVIVRSHGFCFVLINKRMQLGDLTVDSCRSRAV